MALISSSVGNLKSGFNTHQLESIPGEREQTFTLTEKKKAPFYVTECSTELTARFVRVSWKTTPD